VSQSASYRGRIAPSPTGLLHLGHAATFWTAYQRALAAKGTLVLRMEDLDPQRSRPGFAVAAIEDLRWLGIRWQEGPDCGGPCASYLQSERQALYTEALLKLIEGGFIYPCRCSRKDLASLAHAPHEDEPVNPGACRPATNHPGVLQIPRNTTAAPETEVNWRFRVADGEVIHFHDNHFGPQQFVAGKDFGDFLVWRKDSVPAYQLAVAVDDAAMGITEVVRGADLLLSTVRQILLCGALGLAQPSWHHCPLVRDADGQRLAKRQDALSLRTLRASGIPPETVLTMALTNSESNRASADRTCETVEPDGQRHQS
jgi:glutamyl/glutaminyl-tRNA synthetase